MLLLPDVPRQRDDNARATAFTSRLVSGCTPLLLPLVPQFRRIHSADCAIARAARMQLGGSDAYETVYQG